MHRFMMLITAMLMWSVQTPGENLLENGSFEGPFDMWGGIPEVKVPAGWTPWWSEQPHEHDWQNLRPEFDVAYLDYRVHHGATALRYFKSWGSFTAGVYQVVGGIAPGTRLEFSAWGHMWSCGDWERCHAELPAGSTRVWSEPAGAQVELRVGIDPTGGEDPFSDAIVWSPSRGILDHYELLKVEATAQSDRVTVFLYSWQPWAASSQDAYWDDARLVALGTDNPPTFTAEIPTTNPVVTPDPGATRPPAAVVTLPAPSMTPAATVPPVVPGFGHLLAFASDWDGDWELFAADVTENQMMALTDNQADDLDPAWSPDGERLAFASNRAGSWDIYVLDVRMCLGTPEGCAAAEAVQLTEDPADDRAPAWTSDGESIVFQSRRGETWDIYQVAVNGGEVRLLITSGSNNVAPVWQSGEPPY